MKFPLKNIPLAMSAAIIGMTVASTASAITTGVGSSEILNIEPVHLNQNGEPLLDFPRRGLAKLPKRYIIKYKSGNSIQKIGSTTRSSVMSKAASMGVSVDQTFNNINVITAKLSASDASSFSASPDIDYVEIDQPRRFMAQSSPYGIGMVQADLVDDSVAAASAGGKKVCIIDSGLELPHEDMGDQGGTINGTNDSGTGNWYDNGGPHGTHVAGTIGALNNGIGVRGVIGSDVDMHIVKVFNEEGWGYSSSLASAITICAENGADVVNMSLGGTFSTITEENALQAVYDDGVLLIAAAGNDGIETNETDVESYPASYDSVMSVAAIDSAKVLATFSQKNTQVEIAGPGVDVLSTYPTGTGTTADLTIGTTVYDVNGMENEGNVSGELYDLSTGETIDSGATGKVCLIERGNNSFHDKVKTCEDSGGIGSIIFNNVAGSLSATLGDDNLTTIPAVTASQADGTLMLAQIGETTSIDIGAGNYSKISGTSMASPHVAGVATLVWSHHPSCTNQEIRDVLNASAEDLGDAGRDVKFGYGLVQSKAAIDFITDNGCDGAGTVSVGGVLENGVTVSGLLASTGDQVEYTMEVPAGATDLSFEISGGTGDADLYVNFGSEATTAVYDCRPYQSGNNETCNINDVQEGTYHVMLNAYSTFADVNVTGSYQADTGGGGGSDDVLENGISKSGLAAATGEELSFTMVVPEGASDLTFDMSGGTGDADLYVNFGSAASTTDYDCRPYIGGNSEDCPITDVQAGTYHVMIRAFSTFADVLLVGSYSEGGTGGGGGGTASYTNDNDATIPDFDLTGITSDIVVDRMGASNVVSVDLSLVHTYIGDLIVDLIHPDGTVYNLHNRTGGSANDINETYSVDVGSKDSDGTWRLEAKDRARQDTGYIDSWTLTFE